MMRRTCILGAAVLLAASASLSAEPLSAEWREKLENAIRPESYALYVRNNGALIHEISRNTEIGTAASFIVRDMRRFELDLRSGLSVAESLARSRQSLRLLVRSGLSPATENRIAGVRWRSDRHISGPGRSGASGGAALFGKAGPGEPGGLSPRRPGQEGSGK